MSGAGRPTLIDRLIAGGLPNVGLRGATLALRFLVGFYVISHLGLEAAGVYGLAVGAIGVVPAALGWGLNYFVSREVVGLTPDRAAPLVRERLRITLASLAIATAVGATAWLALSRPIADGYLLILALLWLETIALDVYMPLIGLELAWQANLVVFIRSAVWVPVVVALGLADPALRTLDGVFVGWIAGHLASLVALLLLLRRWPIRTGLRGPYERRPFAARLRQSWYIYLSDLGLVGLAYVDRFIVDAMLGLAATGIYSFYWSTTFALQTLVSTAVVQLALPRMIRAFRGESGPAGFRRALTSEMVKVWCYSAALAALILVAVGVIFRLSPGRFPEDWPLLATLLAAAAARSCADLLNVALASTGHDHAYALGNVLGILLTLVLSITLLHAVGLIGAAISALVTALVLAGVRLAYLRPWLAAPRILAS